MSDNRIITNGVLIGLIFILSIHSIFAIEENAISAEKVTIKWIASNQMDNNSYYEQNEDFLIAVFKPKTRKNDISRPEVFWALRHPFKARKALIISKLALSIADSIQRDSILTDASGGDLDAFRHGIWMTLLADKIGDKRAISLGKAHEKSNYLNYCKGRSYTPFEYSLMDSINNLLALKIIREKLSYNELVKMVIDSVKSGYFVVIRKNRYGQPLDIDGNIINSESRIWNKGECLTFSGNRKEIIWEREQSDKLPKY